MTSPARTTEDIKCLILDCLGSALAGLRVRRQDVGNDFDLRAEGVIDSLGFVQLLTALEMRLGLEIDFDELAPDDLTVIGPLSRYIADRCLIAPPGNQDNQ